MNRGNRKLGIVAGALLVLGYLITFTPFFKAYFYYGMLGSNPDASPMAAESWCNTPLGQAAQLGDGTTSSACSSATSWSTFGMLILLVGAVLAITAVVRYFRANAQTA
jgi:disulfide bond formation protein DsbB